MAEAEHAASADALGHAYEELLGQEALRVEARDAEATPEVLAAEPEEPPPPPERIIEALLFVGGPPLSAARAEEVVRGLGPEQFARAVESLNHGYRRQGRPYAIQPQGQGFVLTLRPRFRGVVEKLYGTNREARLSGAAIDVLSLVAYRQPATKQEIDSLRGADSGALLRQLVRRGLVAVIHRAEAGQREVLYGTTSRFLELFGLTSLDDLPRTQDLQQL